MKITVTELIPSSSRKSFYGKAKVVEHGNEKYLLSYSTVVASVDAQGNARRHWNGKSVTTSAHIASFLRQFARRPMTGKEFYALPCTSSRSFETEVR